MGHVVICHRFNLKLIPLNLAAYLLALIFFLPFLGRKIFAVEINIIINRVFNFWCRSLTDF